MRGSRWFCAPFSLQFCEIRPKGLCGFSHSACGSYAERGSATAQATAIRAPAASVEKA